MYVARACCSLNSRQISSSTTTALEWMGLPFALADRFVLSRKHQSKNSCSEGLRGISIPSNPFQREHRKVVCKVSYILSECFFSDFHWTLFAFRVRSLGRTNVTPILTERCSLTSNRREISIRCLQYDRITSQVACLPYCCLHRGWEPRIPIFADKARNPSFVSSLLGIKIVFLGL